MKKTGKEIINREFITNRSKVNTDNENIQIKFTNSPVEIIIGK